MSGLDGLIFGWLDFMFMASLWIAVPRIVIRLVTRGWF